MAIPTPVDIEEARTLVVAAATPLAPESVPLGLALRRVIADEVISELDVPPFSSSAMDGFAVRAADTASAECEVPVPLRLAGEARAGHPSPIGLAAGEAIAISTGAQIPTGADAVLRLERANQLCADVVGAREPVAPGADLRDPGSDVKAGTVLQRAGARLTPIDIGALAAIGRAMVSCHARPTVSVLATGDELAAIGGALAPGHLWDSNSHVLEALAVACGANVVRRETVGDEPASIRRAIIAAAGSDVLVLSGGVSRGAHDHVRPSLEALGASQRFWGIGIRPGAPTWFGVLDGTLVFALPGNPVAAITSFTLLVAPALAALQGLMPPSHKLTARLDDGYEKPPGCAHAVPCRVALRSDGLHACATRAQGPNGLSTMLNADAIAVIPSAVARGGEVAVEPLPASCLSA